MNGIKSSLLSIFSFLHVHLDPRGSFHVQEESKQMIFFLFECGIEFYVLGCVSLHLIHIMTIFENVVLI